MNSRALVPAETILLAKLGCMHERIQVDSMVKSIIILQSIIT